METSLGILVGRIRIENLSSVSTEISPRITSVILKPTDYTQWLSDWLNSPLSDYEETTLQVDQQAYSL